MRYPRLEYTLLGASFLVWFIYVIQILSKTIIRDTIIFPRNEISQTILIRVILSGIVLSLCSLKIGIERLRSIGKNSKKQNKMIMFFFFALMVMIPLGSAYVFDEETQGFSQMIINLSGLMDEDFEDIPPGTNPPGWESESGNWTTVNDNGNIVYYQDDNADKEALSISITGNTSWTDYTYTVDVKFIEGNTKKDDRGALILFRYQGGNSYYFLWMKEHLDVLELHNHGDGAHMVASTGCALVPDVWYHVNVTIQGQLVDVWIDDTQYFNDVNMNGAFDTGSVAVGTSYYKVMFDNIYVDTI